MIRGEIYWTNLEIPPENKPGFRRPVVIIQNDSFNQSNIPTTLVIPLTSNLYLENAPGNVFISKDESGLEKDTVANVSLIMAIDKNRLLEKQGRLNEFTLRELSKGLLLSLGVAEEHFSEK